MSMEYDSTKYLIQKREDDRQSLDNVQNMNKDKKSVEKFLSITTNLYCNGHLWT